MYEQFDIDLSAPLSLRQQAELDALEARPESEIDYSDIPELTDEFFEDAIRNPYMNPDQKLTSAMVDNDVLDWLKSDGPGYRIRINSILRDAMLRAQGKKAESEPAESQTIQQAA